MVNLTDIESIENEAIDTYLNDIDTVFSDELLEGTINVRRDVDDYYEAEGRCLLSGDIIKDWLCGDFWTRLDQYLKSKDAACLYDIAPHEATKSDLSYFNYCLDVCQDVEDYFWDEIYPELCEEYFQKHAEQVY